MYGENKMKKRKISKRYIIIAVVCLAIISVCCMPAGNSGDGGSGYSFTVSRSGEAIKNIFTCRNQRDGSGYGKKENRIRQ